MSLFRKELGEKGEIAAKKELEKRGFKLKEKNFLIRGGEIDLIMEKDEKIIFVEVKTRTDKSFGSPLESITEAKKRHLIHTAQVYLHKHDLDDADVGFWAAAVFADKKNNIKKVEILEDIFV
ncbi:MAG: YraN family protein [Clostridiales bacterium]